MLVCIDVIMLFFEFMVQLVVLGVVGCVVECGLFDLYGWNLCDYVEGNYCWVDDCLFGGGFGMVMLIELLCVCLVVVKVVDLVLVLVIYLSLQGQLLIQVKVWELVVLLCMILLCGCYEGVDECFLVVEVIEEILIGDYVLFGGELGVVVIVDVVIWLQEGVFGDVELVVQDSFEGLQGLLDCLYYSYLVQYEWGMVFDVLCLGNYVVIVCWCCQQLLLWIWLCCLDLLDESWLFKVDWFLFEQVWQVYSGDVVFQCGGVFWIRMWDCYCFFWGLVGGIFIKNVQYSLVIV